MRKPPRRSTEAERAAGARYQRWTLVDRAIGEKVLARCDCGTEKVVYFLNLRNGVSRSCGCLAREVCGANARRHGGTGTPEHRAWNSMKSRCLNPSGRGFKHYGGRGIAVSHDWLGKDGFTRFLADVGPRPSPKHSLDRIDNDGNYEPSNVRWATDKEQARNTRRNVWLEHGGRRMLATDWATHLGISRQALEQRIRWGWSVEKICTTPAPVAASRLRGRVPGSRKLVLGGVRDTVAGWSRRTGVSDNVIGQRLRTGRSLEEALSPVRLPTRHGRHQAPPATGTDGQGGE